MREKLIELIDEAAELYPSELESIADHLIANGVTVQQWIPVAEQLPNKNDDVLCSRGNHIGAMMDVYTYIEDHYWEDSYGYLCREEDEGITHWMHLPEPPKGE